MNVLCDGCVALVLYPALPVPNSYETFCLRGDEGKQSCTCHAAGSWRAAAATLTLFSPLLYVAVHVYGSVVVAVVMALPETGPPLVVDQI